MYLIFFADYTPLTSDPPFPGAPGHKNDVDDVICTKPAMSFSVTSQKRGGIGPWVLLVSVSNGETDADNLGETEKESQSADRVQRRIHLLWGKKERIE